MINFIKEILFIFIASGGCGCLNHYILTNTNVIEEHTDLYKERITLGSLISINLLMCFGFIEFGHLSLYKSVLITFLLTLISSFTVHVYVIKFFRTLVNLIRKGKGLSEMTFGTIQEDVFESDNMTIGYFYTREGSFIACGYIEMHSERTGEFTIAPRKSVSEKSFSEACALPGAKVFINDEMKIVTIEQE